MPDARPRDDAHSITLTDGTATRTGQAAPVDLVPVQELHRRCSPGSRALRYHAGKSGLSPAEWRRLSSPERGTTLVTAPAGRTDHIIAVLDLRILLQVRPAGGDSCVNHRDIEGSTAAEIRPLRAHTMF
ncbi:hypothetical protein ABT187_06845 [Streptomyces sp. NPDC001817]|uniref:hypothetical protein n=1 Tax=Streptomyces sp. NPDC001817 TaxID=3154398 RepID=UPI003327A213